MADFVAGEPLEYAHHAGVVPGRAAGSDRGVEQLLTGRRIRQADAETARSLQREVQVLLMQRDAETRIKIALDDPLAVDLENARGGETAHERLTHAGWIGAGLGGTAALRRRPRWSTRR